MPPGYNMTDPANTIAGHLWDKLPLRVPPDLRGHVEKHKESNDNRNTFVHRIRRRSNFHSRWGVLTSKFTKTGQDAKRYSK